MANSTATASKLTLTMRGIKDFLSTESVDKSVIIADEFAYTLVGHIDNSICIESNTVYQYDLLRRMDVVREASIVFGVGGCAALDLAKAVSIDKDTLVVVPTILSTNCISNPQSVIGAGLNSVAFLSRRPDNIIVSLYDIMNTESGDLSKWTQSGFGDYFSSISGSMDIAFFNNCLQKDYVFRISRSSFLALYWVINEFNGYTIDCMTYLANLAHSSSMSIDGKHCIGGEHLFYNSIIELEPSARYSVTHGQIVALGTILTAKAFQNLTDDAAIYMLLRKAFKQLGIPLTYEELSRLNISKELIYAALHLLGSENIFDRCRSLLGKYIQDFGTSFVDDALQEW